MIIPLEQLIYLLEFCELELFLKCHLLSKAIRKNLTSSFNVYRIWGHRFQHEFIRGREESGKIFHVEYEKGKNRQNEWNRWKKEFKIHYRLRYRLKVTQAIPNQPGEIWSVEVIKSGKNEEKFYLHTCGSSNQSDIWEMTRNTSSNNDNKTIKKIAELSNISGDSMSFSDFSSDGSFLVTTHDNDGIILSDSFVFDIPRILEEKKEQLRKNKTIKIEGKDGLQIVRNGYISDSPLRFIYKHFLLISRNYEVQINPENRNQKMMTKTFDIAHYEGRFGNMALVVYKILVRQSESTQEILTKLGREIGVFPRFMDSEVNSDETEICILFTGYSDEYFRESLRREAARQVGAGMNNNDLDTNTTTIQWIDNISISQLEEDHENYKMRKLEIDKREMSGYIDTESMILDAKLQNDKIICTTRRIYKEENITNHNEDNTEKIVQYTYKISMELTIEIYSKRSQKIMQKFDTNSICFSLDPIYRVLVEVWKDFVMTGTEEGGIVVYNQRFQFPVVRKKKVQEKLISCVRMVGGERDGALTLVIGSDDHEINVLNC